MEAITQSAPDAETPKCPQCNNTFEVAVKRTVIGRGFNPVTRKQFVEKRDMTFCSEQCGLHHQYSLEG